MGMSQSNTEEGEYRMKFDMHCHVKEGSIDSKITLSRYIELLKSKGFSGMLITDHDSYKGYDAWISSRSDDDDFVVLRGIEYDTRDAGHFIVITPDEISLDILTIRGMSVEELIHVVHKVGGILGPAHPFGAKSSSSMFSSKMRKNPHLVSKFDFIEGFNTCEKYEANEQARKLAQEFGLPCIGGSDSHCEDHVASAATIFDGKIENNNDLIDSIKNGKIKFFGGMERKFLFRNKFRYLFPVTWGFKAFNRGVGFIYSPIRLRKLNAIKALPAYAITRRH
jgi:predicted metal-dependent phosphoesterase TrpH